MLAEMWHLKPWELGDAPIVWVLRASEFYSLKAKLRK